MVQRSSKQGAAYAREDYVRYDHGLDTSDEVKKELERELFEDVLAFRHGIFMTLDIGSASGRYPGLLRAKGLSSYGVDIEPEAVLYAQEQSSSVEGPIFAAADGRDLPFPDRCFDLVSAMMGTISHVSLSTQREVLAEAARVTRPGGVLVISTWDPECPFPGLLDLYDDDERSTLLEQSRTREAMVGIVHLAGYEVESVKGFCALPDDVTRTPTDGAVKAAEIDQVLMARFPELHPQMYMIVARRLAEPRKVPVRTS